MAGDVRGQFEDLTLQDPIDFSYVPLPTPSLTRILELCTEPGRLRAFLNLWPERVNTTNSATPVNVDYARPISDVYTDAARFILQSSQDLRILSYVDRRTSTPGLPSWVPDWSQRTSWRPLDTQARLKESEHNLSGTSPFNAANDQPWKPCATFIQDFRSLTVQGKKIGTVSVIAQIGMDNGPELRPVLSGVPYMYPYFKLSPLEEDNPLVGFTAAPMSDSLTQYANRLVSDETNTLTAAPHNGTAREPMVITKTHRYAEIYQQSRFEALWRTLIADVWQFEHCAPDAAGHAFVSYYIAEMRSLHARAESMMAGGEGSIEDFELEWRKRIYVLDDLAEDEKLSLTYYREGASDNVPRRFLPDINGSDDILNFEVEDEAAKAWSAHQTLDRLLFATSTRKMGLGPLPTEVEDEVWILAGSRYPFVLRPLPDGHHELVGEAYVHGIMQGEACWFDVKDFVQVVLV